MTDLTNDSAVTKRPAAWDDDDGREDGSGTVNVSTEDMACYSKLVKKNWRVNSPCEHWLRRREEAAAQIFLLAPAASAPGTFATMR